MYCSYFLYRIATDYSTLEEISNMVKGAGQRWLMPYFFATKAFVATWENLKGPDCLTVNNQFSNKAIYKYLNSVFELRPSAVIKGANKSFECE